MLAHPSSPSDYPRFHRLTCEQVQRQNPLALGLPAGHLDIHLVHVVLVRQFFGVLGGGPGLSPAENLSPLLLDSASAVLQALLRLRLDHVLLGQRYDVPGGGVEGADGQDGELEEEHDHHSGASIFDDGVDGVSKKPQVVCDAQKERETEAGVEEKRVRGRLLLEDLDTAIPYPTPDLARDEGGKHDEEEGAKLFAEDGDGEACLGDGEPSLLIKVFDFGGAEGSEAEALEAIHE